MTKAQSLALVSLDKGSARCADFYQINSTKFIKPIMSMMKAMAPAG